MTIVTIVTGIAPPASLKPPPTPLFRGGVAGAVLVGGRAVCCCVWRGVIFL